MARMLEELWTEVDRDIDETQMPPRKWPPCRLQVTEWDSAIASDKDRYHRFCQIALERTSSSAWKNSKLRIKSTSTMNVPKPL
jgi:hypothetical protein